MTKEIVIVALALLLASLFPRAGHGHCQVPCGIYDDAARIARMNEDAETIGKSMEAIAELAGKGDSQSANQLTRWIMTKEAHASNIISTVAEYFLTQKVKPVEPGADEYDAYLEMLADHHRVMAAAMKVKQSTDPDRLETLRRAISALALRYAVDNGD